MIYLMLLVLVLFPLSAQASTIAAASCERAAVQTAVTAAVAGDTVTVPAGTCTWTSAVAITGKTLTLTGAGVGTTILRAQFSSPILTASVSAANFVTISGFTFQEVTASSGGMVAFDGTRFQVGFRFHDNRLEHSITGGRGVYVRNTYGLIDNIWFEVGAGSVQSVSVEGTDTSTDGGYRAWDQTLSLGSENAVFVEDCTFNSTDISGEDSIDAYGGARFVIRYNTFINAHVGFHGLDSGGIRSPVSVEVYNNEFRNTTATSAGAGRMRGGTGVWHHNDWTTTSSGTWTNIALTNYRACASTVFSWLACNGTQYVVGGWSLSSTASRYCCDYSTNPTSGVGGCAAWPSLNWVGNFGFDATNKDLLVSGALGTHGVGNNTAFLDGSGTGGYPCRDQVGRAPGQVLEPVYAWSNTGSQTLIAFDVGTTNCGGFGLTNYIEENRDYYNETARPGYTAYTYPHPLQSVGEEGPPEPDVIAGTPASLISTSTSVIFIWPPSTDADHKAYNVYRCTFSDACLVLVKTWTPATAAAAHSPETRFIDISSALYTAGTYYYSVADVNTSDYIGPATTPVSVTVIGKQ